MSIFHLLFQCLTLTILTSAALFGTMQIQQSITQLVNFESDEQRAIHCGQRAAFSANLLDSEKWLSRHDGLNQSILSEIRRTQLQRLGIDEQWNREIAQCSRRINSRFIISLVQQHSTNINSSNYPNWVPRLRWAGWTSAS